MGFLLVQPAPPCSHLPGSQGRSVGFPLASKRRNQFRSCVIVGAEIANWNLSRASRLECEIKTFEGKRYRFFFVCLKRSKNASEKALTIAITRQTVRVNLFNQSQKSQTASNSFDSAVEFPAFVFSQVVRARNDA